MPSRNIVRCTWLIDTLHRKGGCTLAELQAAWEQSPLSEGSQYSPRTLSRDKYTIADVFGIDIVCKKSRGYKHELDTKIDEKNATARELLLSMISVANLLTEGRSLNNRIQVDELPKGEEYFRDLIEAMRKGQVLEICYESYWCPGQYTYRIEPYVLKSFRRRWYLLGRPQGSRQIKIYALDRVSSLIPTEEHFSLPDDFDAEEYFYDSYGIMVDEEYDVEEVHLKAYGVRVRYMDSLPLHHSQRKVAETADWAEYSLRLRPTIDFCQELMSTAYELEVLAPEWLRQEMQGRLKTAESFYKDKPEDKG